MTGVMDAMAEQPNRAGGGQVFRLPDVGEGLTEAEIVGWRVAVGQQVAVNDVLVEIETAKSLVELPSPFEGEVAELLVGEGDTIEVGAPIVRFADAARSAEGGGPNGSKPGQPMPEGEPDQPQDQSRQPPAGEPVQPQAPAGGGESAGRSANLVGYGARRDASVHRRRRLSIADTAPTHATAARDHEGVGDSARSAVLAKPPVRRLARELGVDLAEIRPSGPRGTVTREDVADAARAKAQTEVTVDATPESGAGSGARRGRDEASGIVGPDETARETRVVVRSVRRMTADAVTASAFSAPHVTEFLEVDVTRSYRLLDRLRVRRDFVGLKVSPILLVAKAMCLAAGRTPEINASWDGPSNEIVYKHYVNLGIAAATPRGLLVPNVKDAERMPLPQLCREINDLVAIARAGQTSPDQMQGGTITLTNVGVFGVDTGTPILNAGESAILAVGAVADRPWVHKGKVKPRKVMTLALSFDHRVVDGEQGSRFLADVGVILSDPATTLLWT